MKQFRQWCFMAICAFVLGGCAKTEEHYETNNLDTLTTSTRMSGGTDATVPDVAYPDSSGMGTGREDSAIRSTDGAAGGPH